MLLVLTIAPEIDMNVTTGRYHMCFYEWIKIMKECGVCGGVGVWVCVCVCVCVCVGGGGGGGGGGGSYQH